MIEKFTSIQNVISKVYRDLNLQDESRWEDMIEWSAEAMEQIGSFSQYEHKAETFEVENFRLKIPCDLHKIVGIEYNGNALHKISGNFDVAVKNSKIENLRSTSYHGYTLSDSYINFNFKQGEINLSYIGILTDEDGFPMIPDNISFKEAIERYIVMKMNYPNYVLGTINLNHWQMLQSDWHKYCMQARGTANMPNADQMESIKNQWNRLKPMMNEHSLFFNKLGNTERITRT